MKTRKQVTEANHEMKRNVEIKARISDFESVCGLVMSIADSGPEVISQEDTFFKNSTGRLKLRKFSDSKGELIYYERSNSDNPAECRYLIAPTTEPATLLEILSRSNVIRGIVRKERTLYTTGQTRIHLDEVEGLGWFIELEVVLRPEQNAPDGIRVADDLIRRLGIAESDLIDCAYIDLLEDNAR